MKKNYISIHSSLRAFTLIEVLMATAMFSVLLLAVHSLIGHAINLREKAEYSVRIRQDQTYAMSLIKRDLINITAPSDVITGSFLGEKGGNLKLRRDSVVFHTTTGLPQYGTPWGEIQKIEYSLIEPKDFYPDEPLRQQGYALVRSVYRNLLSSTEELPEMVPLLSNVESVQFTYYDGETWYDSWDSETQDPPLPIAVRMYLVQSVPKTRFGESEDTRYQKNALRDELVLECTVPIVCVAVESEESTGETDTDQATSEEGDSQTGDGGQGDQTSGQQNGGQQSGGQRQ